MENNLFISMTSILVVGHLIAYLRYRKILKNLGENELLIQTHYNDAFYRSLNIVIKAAKFCSFTLAILIIIKMIISK